ncbi:MAG: SprT-like domain-containing protein [Chromatiaceae bacterium]|jgi:SprT protein|nr:SprT-like domain-containing protein [Chromatiaceae bacterium]
MRPRAAPSDSSGLQQQAVALTRQFLALASRLFGSEPTTPSIRFDLRGKSAGQVRYTERDGFLIRYNSLLLERHPQEFLSQTVPHEAAHLVAFSLFGPRVPPHGREWRAVMAAFGARPDRCHSFSVEGLQTRRLRRYHYRCACRTHHLTSIRHNRILSGQVYLCKQCGQPLGCEPEPPVD